MTFHKVRRHMLVVASVAIVTAGVIVAVRVARSGGATGVEPATVADSFAWPTPDSTGAIMYSDVMTRPVPAGLTTAISRDQALAVARSLGFTDLTPGEPRISLRMATRRLDKRGQGEGFENRLSWIIEYPNSPIVIFGPPDMPADQRRWMEETSACEFVIVVDATSGVALSSQQSCHQR